MRAVSIAVCALVIVTMMTSFGLRNEPVGQEKIQSMVTSVDHGHSQTEQYDYGYHRDFSSTTNCTPNHNVYYVKVHKTGSTTISTLLQRMVLRYNLKHLNVKSMPFPFGTLTEEMMLGPGQKATETISNVFHVHAKFNATEATKLMHKDTVYIASIRYSSAFSPLLLSI